MSPDVDSENQNKLRFVELDAAQLPRGLNPAKDAIARENAEGPWVNILAVREEDKDKPWVKQLTEAHQSEPVKAFLDSRFKGTYIAAW